MGADVKGEAVHPSAASASKSVGKAAQIPKGGKDTMDSAEQTGKGSKEGNDITNSGQGSRAEQSGKGAKDSDGIDRNASTIKDGSAYGKDRSTYGKDGGSYGKGCGAYGKDGAAYGKVGKDGESYGKDAGSHGKGSSTYGKDSGGSYGKDGGPYSTDRGAYGKDGNTYGKAAMVAQRLGKTAAQSAKMVPKAVAPLAGLTAKLTETIPLVVPLLPMSRAELAAVARALMMAKG